MPRKNKRSKAASARNVKRVATTQNTSENVANNSSTPNASVETESCDVAGYANINFIDRVRGNFHQGDEQFSQFSRGVQCSCNALSMLCKVDSLIQKLKPCHLDGISRNGDQLYRVTAQNLDTQNELANDGYLEIHQLPTHIAVVDLNYTADYEILRYGKIHEDPLYSHLESLDIGLRSAFTASEKVILVYDDSILALYHDVTSEQYLFLTLIQEMNQDFLPLMEDQLLLKKVNHQAAQIYRHITEVKTWNTCVLLMTTTQKMNQDVQHGKIK